MVAPEGNARGDHGSGSVELVIILPLAMILLVLAVQAALWVHADQVVQLSAAQGEQVAQSFGGSLAAGRARALTTATVAGSDVSRVSVSVALLPADIARVSVSGDAESILPGLRFPVSAVQSGPVQEFRTSG
jgi:hypothetical protein